MASRKVAMLAAFLLLLVACGTRAPQASPRASFQEKFADLAARAQTYQEDLRQYNSDIQPVLAEQQMLLKHPAYADLQRKLDTATSRAYVETIADPKNREARTVEILKEIGLNADDVALLQVLTMVDGKAKPLQERRAHLESIRQGLAEELTALQLEGEKRRQQRADEIQTLQLLQLLSSQGTTTIQINRK